MEHSAIERDRGRAAVLLRATMSATLAIARPARRLLACSCAALALCAAPAGASTLVIEGAGDGHGVGMSQDGALGYAEHGWSDGAILAHYYTGTTLGQAPAKSVVKVLEGSKVMDVPLERYVRGVVAAEMPSSWPMAALEAQAIASRTYALTSDAGGSRFDVYSDTRSQMYLGTAAETATTNAAIAATAGQIVEYAGQPAITYYFASLWGHDRGQRELVPRLDARAVAAGGARLLRNEVLQLEGEHQLRLGRNAAGRAGEGLVSRDRGAQTRRVPTDRGGRGARLAW